MRVLRTSCSSWCQFCRSAACSAPNMRGRHCAIISVYGDRRTPGSRSEGQTSATLQLTNPLETCDGRSFGNEYMNEKSNDHSTRCGDCGRDAGHLMQVTLISNRDYNLISVSAREKTELIARQARQGAMRRLSIS